MGNLCHTKVDSEQIKTDEFIVQINKTKCKTTKFIDFEDESSLHEMICTHKLNLKLDEDLTPIEKIKSSMNLLSIVLSNENSTFEIFQKASLQIFDHILNEINGNFKLLSKFWVYFLYFSNEVYQKKLNNKNYDVGQNEFFFLRDFLIPSIDSMEEGFWKSQILKTCYSLENLKNNDFLVHYFNEIEKNLYQNLFFQLEESLNDISMKLEKKPKDLKLQYLSKSLDSIIQTIKKKDKDLIVKSILSHRFEKKIFDLPHTIISGEDGGLYFLLNSVTNEEIQIMKTDEISQNYLEKITLDSKKNKMVIGEGGCGKIRLSIALTLNELSKNGEISMHIGDIICVKKTRCVGFKFDGNEEEDGLLIEEIRANVWNDYSTGNLAKYLHSPNVYDVLQIDLCNPIDKIHKKGYTFQQFLPVNDGNIFRRKKEFQTWKHQKKYFLDIMTAISGLLNQGVCMTDLKPGNTLYDFGNMQGRLIDLAGVVRKKTRKELESCKIKYIREFTEDFSAPELLNFEDPEKQIDLCKAICYNFGVMIEKLIFKVKHFDCMEKEKLRNLQVQLIQTDPNERISLETAISILAKIGEEDLDNNFYNLTEFVGLFKDFFKSEENLENFGLNREILKLKKMIIDPKVSELDPEKYKDLQEEDLNVLFEKFFHKDNKKDAIFLLMGASGSGKSTILQIKFLEMLENWQKGDPIPIYMNLSSDQDLRNRWKLINEEIKKINKDFYEIGFNFFSGVLKYPTVVFLDSYDEARIQTNLVQKIYEDLGFNLNNKIIITCRSDYLQTKKEIDEKFKIENTDLLLRYISPLDLRKIDVKGYLKRYLTASNSSDNVDIYDEKLEKGNLKEFTKTNFMLHLILQVLPEFKPNDKFSNFKIYESYTQGRIKKESQKLAKVHKDSIKSEFKLSNDDQSLFEFAENLARDLAENLLIKNKSRLDSNEDVEFFARYHYINDKSLKSQNIFNICKIVDLRLELLGKLPNEKIKIGFSHDSIKIFYLSTQILKEAKQSIDSIISKRNITENRILIQFLAENIKNNDSLIKTFKNFILKSRANKEPSTYISAANAITLLIASDVNFINEDLSSIVIRNADIRSGIFSGSDFSYADLTNVNMSHCKLQQILLNKTILKDIKLGIYHSDIKTESGILCLCLSKDQNELLCGCQNGNIYYYNIKHKRSFFNKAKNSFSLGTIFQGHASSVKSVNFSPDESIIISAGVDTTIKVWNKIDGKLIKTLSGHQSWVNSACFSSNGKTILSCSEEIILWDFESGKILNTFESHTSMINSCCFSPDEKYILSASKDRTVKLWEKETGKLMRTFSGHSHYVNQAAFSSTGKEIISVGNDQNLLLWNIESDTPIRTFTGHSNWVNSVCFSPDDVFIWSASCDKSIKLWEKSSGKLIKSYESHSAEIKTLRFAKNGQFFISGGLDNIIKFWETSYKKNLKHNQGHQGSVYFVTFSHDGNSFISTGNDNLIKQWDLKNSTLLQVYEGHTKWCNSLLFLPNDDKIISASADLTIRIWECSTGKCLNTLLGHLNYVNSVSLSSDGKFFVSGGEDIVINIWDVLGNLLKKIEETHEYPITCVAFSPKMNDYFISSSNDNTIKLWQKTGTCLRVYQGHTNSVKFCCFSPDGNQILSASVDSTLKLWDYESGNIIYNFKGHQKEVNCCFFSFDGKLILSGGSDKAIKLWNVITGEELENIVAHEDSVNTVCFSPNGKLFISGSEDKSMKIWGKLENNKQTKKSKEWILINEIAANETGIFCDGIIIKNPIELSENNDEILKSMT